MNLFKRLKILILIIIAFVKKEKKLILLSFFGAMALFFLAAKFAFFIPKPKPTEKIGIIGNYTFETLPKEILKLCSNGLTKINPDGSPAPSLAEKWEVSEDGKTYTFYLENNIFWQDGTPITTQDMEINLKDVKVEKVDLKTFRFILPEPYSPFPVLLSEPVFKKNYIGTGRFKIAKVEYKGQYIKTLFLTSAEKNLRYSFYPTETKAYLAFKLGEINQLPEVYVNPFDESWSAFLSVEEKIKKDQYIGLFINYADPDLKNKNLRQALAYATVKPEDDTKALGPINPNSWAYNPEVKSYPANAKQAKKLYNKFLEEANKNNLKLKIDTTGNFLLLAEQIKNNWQEILGIEVEISLIDRIPDDFQILLIVSKIPDDPDQYSFWHSTQETNLTHYKSVKTDKILEDARRIQDIEKRKEKYFDFQKFILEDCPVIFISHPKTLVIKRKSFSFFN